MSTHWNYRVVRRVFNEGKPDQEIIFGIHEAYYDGTKVMSITEDPVEVSGEDKATVRKELEHMMRALDKPVLNWANMSELKEGT